MNIETLSKKQQSVLKEIEFNLQFFHKKLPKSFYEDLTEQERGDVIRALKRRERKQ